MKNYCVKKQLKGIKIHITKVNCDSELKKNKRNKKKL